MEPLDNELLYAFAGALMRNDGNAMAAAKEISGDTETIVRLASEGMGNPVVLQAVEEISRGDIDDSMLPSKGMLAREIWNHTRGIRDPELKQKGYKLYADVMGFITKPSTVVNNNNTANFTTVKAIPQPVYHDEDELQNMILTQQRKLVEGTLYPSIDATADNDGVYNAA